MGRHKILSNPNTKKKNMGVSAEFAKFFVLVALSAQYALAQTSQTQNPLVGATDAPNVTSGAGTGEWYDNPVTMAVIIIILNMSIVAIAGPLLVKSYRKCQAQY